MEISRLIFLCIMLWLYQSDWLPQGLIAHIYNIDFGIKNILFESKLDWSWIQLQSKLTAFFTAINKSQSFYLQGYFFKICFLNHEWTAINSNPFITFKSHLFNEAFSDHHACVGIALLCLLTIFYCKMLISMYLYCSYFV